MSFAILVKISNIENPNAPNAIILEKKRTQIGRRSEIHMDTNKGKEISKHHAAVLHDLVNDTYVWLLEDRHSLNGTFVNGRKIVRMILRSKDEVIFGGGAEFRGNDMINTPELSECRYRFFVPEHKINFKKCHDLNICINDKEKEECCICYAALHKMEQLQCGHTFCSHCLNHWVKVCAKSMRPSLCPICRNPFTKSDISKEDISITHGRVIVNSIVPLLKILNINEITQLDKFKFTEKWSDDTKREFWEYFNSIEEYRPLQKIFRHYTGMTLDKIFKASNEELKNMHENLDGDPNLDGEELKRDTFARFCVMLLKAREIKAPNPAKMRMRRQSR
ncbi:FHA domain containing protein [Tritrichomonas foetus]|uniref:E3 ubiquitin-protein ligase CHFR n=1 Tax=Tritrichomonas foetus TaxID=1144522 RepID=A0A1J4L1R7_9EUKA|nr:FHA domain containing protein [Tritrichomonas foetus]|eukprot:OHT17016.1 FHA domain containing protein [Tritrichomonas foetus]